MDPWRKVRASAEAAVSLGDLALLELGEHAGTPRQTVLNALRARALVLLPDASEQDKTDARQALADVQGSTVLAVIEGRPSEVTDDDGHGVRESGHDGLPSMSSSTPPESPPPHARAGIQPGSSRVVGRLTRARIDGRIVITGMAAQRGR